MVAVSILRAYTLKKLRTIGKTGKTGKTLIENAFDILLGWQRLDVFVLTECDCINQKETFFTPPLKTLETGLKLNEIYHAICDILVFKHHTGIFICVKGSGGQ